MRSRPSLLATASEAVAALVLCAALAGCSSDSSVRAGDAAEAITDSSGASTTSTPSTPDPPPSQTPPTSSPSTPSTTAGDTSSSAPATTAPPVVEDLPTGLGDEPFPELGAPELDVSQYDVRLTWDAEARRIGAVVGITFQVGVAQAEVSFDATEDVQVGQVVLDDEPIDFRAEPPELIITPVQPFVPGQDYVVNISYKVEMDEDGSGGWLISDFGSYTLNEPDLARTWLPCNDHPSDKATWKVELTVHGAVGVSNGNLVAHTTSSGWDTYNWEMDAPMATYLAQVLTGPYEIVTAPADGFDVTSAVLTEDRDELQPYLDGVAPMVTWFEQWFGEYPFDSYGLAVADSPRGLAMEQQTRSLFPRTLFTDFDEAGVQNFLAHELGHQWFGDAVTPASWQDVWLNESFATYASWMWGEHEGYASVDDAAQQALSFGREVAPDAPGEALFGNEVYDGGATALHALRRTVGDETFFQILRTWATDNFGMSRTTEDFTAHAEAVSGQDLDEFFDTWLHTADPPDTYP